MKRFPFILALIALLAACASEQPITQPSAKVEDRTQAPKTAQPADTHPLVPPQQAVNPLKDPNNILSKRSVFYDYDSFDVKAEYNAMLEAHAGYLVANPNAKVALQGNAEERGSREYNLALGQKRADGVRKVLSLRGVKEDQMESVSFGEEKPRAECHEESCWSQNRRTDIVYQGE